MPLWLSRLGWFAGIWAVSVLGLALVGALIRWWLR
ncbi:DUF2474 family protein [Sphingobium yanoikuyae]|uniref:DUF2474 family protein n=1 Tax=Sphingobium yanoikuyae TaxID=13690 RepID=A0AA42WXE4_SPHYA|nr:MULTISPECIES: DUF2474 family protein [Sphingomonadaceae]MDH2132281.1 DUF2474 family protein [Sphingobium yanoikuyae]MDH2150124.1 DUF2474 family protein [Sphingobium yanoikuyae]MDH2168816.1 DUF2474 family protein [Sphingobium yanoikuyae]WIA59040.1 DUF2474 family protein [Sphingobium sp. WTD-1]